MELRRTREGAFEVCTLEVDTGIRFKGCDVKWMATRALGSTRAAERWMRNEKLRYRKARLRRLREAKGKP